MYIRQLIFMVEPFFFQQQFSLKIPTHVSFAIWLELPPEAEHCHHNKLIIPISSFLPLCCYSQAGVAISKGTAAGNPQPFRVLAVAFICSSCEVLAANHVYLIMGGPKETHVCHLFLILSFTRDRALCVR